MAWIDLLGTVVSSNGRSSTEVSRRLDMLGGVMASASMFVPLVS